jgi:hypothetical protein
MEYYSCCSFLGLCGFFYLHVSVWMLICSNADFAVPDIWCWESVCFWFPAKKGGGDVSCCSCVIGADTH